jgi:stage V sporulation protein G
VRGEASVEITEIRVTLRDEEKLRGFANFVSMPSRKRPDGTHQDIAHPVNKDMRVLIEKRVLEAYEAELKTQAASSK